MNLTTTDSQATGFPLVIPTQTQQPTARLQLRNSHGQVIQQWLVKSNKCTLGSAVSCSLRCELPGVAPYHALLVIGARQVFIRALAPKLTRDGQPFSELLLTNDDGHFEISGHRFELSRNNLEVESAARAEASTAQRIKFTLARPFELRNRQQAAPITHPNAAQQAAEIISDSRTGGDSKWVAQMIQAAMQPIECQLHNLSEPLSELQRESRNQRRLRKRRAIRKRKAAAERSARVSQDLPQETPSQFAEQAHLAEQVEAIAVQHSAAMDVLTERVAEVNQQLQAIERIVEEQRQASQVKEEPQPAPESPRLILQSAAIEQLQQSVISVSSILDRLQAEQVTVREDDQQWKDGLQSQLGSLAQVIEGLSASVTEVHHVALRAVSQPAADTQPDYWSQTAVDSQPVANCQPDANLQSDADSLPAPNSLLASLPSTPEAWGLATDELAPSAIDPEPPTWTTLEPDDAIAEQASELEAELEASDDVDSALLPELAQPAIDQEQPTWSALEPDDAIEERASEIEASGDIVQPDSTSLPSWWADDATDRELQSSSANGHYVEPCDSHIAERDVESSGDTDVRVSQGASDIDERIYENTSASDERISESVYVAKCQSTARPAGDVEKPSEEFFGLAQLDLEEHLREAEPLPRALVPTAHAADASRSEAVPNEARRDGNPAERIVENPAECTVENAAECTVENAAEIDEADSIEEYMRKLLARMRGVPEEEVELQQPAAAKPAEAGAPAVAPTATASVDGGLGDQSAADQPTGDYTSGTDAGGLDVTEPFDPEKYMPRALAPERSNSLAAMRELANSSARTAIHKSTRQRHVNSIVLKSVIAGVGLVVGMALLAINGLSLNIGLVATVASFLVAVIWGYDSISSIRPMLQSGLVLKPQADSIPAPAGEQSEDQTKM